MTEVPFSPFLQRCRAAFESVTDIFFVVDLASGGDLFYHLASKVRRATKFLHDKNIADRGACFEFHFCTY